MRYAYATTAATAATLAAAGAYALAYGAPGPWPLLALSVALLATGAALAAAGAIWPRLWRPVAVATLARRARMRAGATYAAAPTLANLAAHMRARRAYAHARWPIQ
jgi:hypothetical protein